MDPRKASTLKDSAARKKSALVKAVYKKKAVRKWQEVDNDESAGEDVEEVAGKLIGSDTDAATTTASFQHGEKQLIVLAFVEFLNIATMIIHTLFCITMDEKILKFKHDFSSHGLQS